MDGSWIAGINRSVSVEPSLVEKDDNGGVAFLPRCSVRVLSTGRKVLRGIGILEVDNGKCNKWSSVDDITMKGPVFDRPIASHASVPVPNSKSSSMLPKSKHTTMRTLLAGHRRDFFAGSLATP